jgi:hypothetical protein
MGTLQKAMNLRNSEALDRKVTFTFLVLFVLLAVKAEDMLDQYQPK